MTVFGSRTIQDVVLCDTSGNAYTASGGGGGGGSNLGAVAWSTPGAINLGTASTQLAAARSGVSGTGRVQIIISNQGTDTIYIGPGAVSSATGFPIAAGTSVTLPTQGAVFGIAATGTQAVGVLELF